MSKGYGRAVGALIMCIFCFMSYGPLALTIDDYAVNETTTNAIWVLLDSTFGLFWSLVIIAWLAMALWFVLSEIG